MSTSPRIIHKHVIDASGNWVSRPYLIWRDATGIHDRPATADEINNGAKK